MCLIDMKNMWVCTILVVFYHYVQQMNLSDDVCLSVHSRHIYALFTLASSQSVLIRFDRLSEHMVKSYLFYFTELIFKGDNLA